MPNQVNFEWDDREFDATLLQYANETKKDLFEVCNQKGFQLAGGYGAAHPGALQLTKFADPAKIGQQLALEVESIQRVTRSGKIRIVQRRSFGTDDSVKKTLAARIVNARLVKEGKPPIWGAKLREAARKLTSARVRSAKFIASGWIAVIRILAPIVGRGGNTTGVSLHGQLKGYAVPATFGWHPVCEVANTALNPKHGQSVRGVAVAEEGLRKAVSAVTEDTKQYLEQRLAATAARHSVR